MKKTRELIEAHLKLVDVVIEVCDARIPASSRNPIISELTAGKRRVLILNKNDLADEGATKTWLDFFRADGLDALALNAMSGQGVKALYGKLDRIAAEKAASGTSKAKLPVRLMVVGIPNSGKSSLINRLVGKRATQVGDRPGVTRGKQWLSLENGMQLLDTPGILWPKFEDPEVGLNLAFCGSIKDEIMDSQDLALELLKVLLRENQTKGDEQTKWDVPSVLKKHKTLGTSHFVCSSHFVLLAERYGLEAGSSRLPAEASVSGSQEYALEVMEEIAKKRGYILPGKRIDYERTARALLDDFRSGKIGRITLELPA